MSHRFSFCAPACAAQALLISLLLAGCSGGGANTAHDDDCALNLFIISSAIQHVQDTAIGGFDDIRDKDGRPLLSWRVKMLDFLEEAPLRDQFRLDEPWDSEHNRKLLTKMPKVFRCPADADATSGNTRYRIAFGAGSLFDGTGRNALFESVPDGRGQTIVVFESAAAVPWTKPDSLTVDEAAGAVSKEHGGGAWAAFADGAVRFIPGDTPAATVKAMLTADGKETVAVDVLRVNAAAADLKRRSDDFAKKMYGGGK